nr:hypothetical protein BaRGS_017390 [Batillaria attramentaria]
MANLHLVFLIVISVAAALHFRDDEKTRLATYLEGLLSKFPSIKLTVAFLPNSGIEISNYTWADYGQCVKGVSALRLGAHVHVDEVEARLTLLEGGTVDTKLTSDVEQLAKELKALIQQTESKCAADVDYLRQQVSDIRNTYNTCCSTDIPDISTSPADITRSSSTTETSLDKIHRLTSSRKYSLRVDLEDFDGSTAYAEYRDFSISGPDDFYRLHVGEYRDSIDVAGSNQNNQQFTTRDQDHDPHPGTGITWYYWKKDWRSYKHVEMKVKPWL